MTLRRWWQRLLPGPAVALRSSCTPCPDDGRHPHPARPRLPDEPGLAEALDGRLVACYRDSRSSQASRELAVAAARSCG